MLIDKLKRGVSLNRNTKRVSGQIQIILLLTGIFLMGNVSVYAADKTNTSPEIEETNFLAEKYFGKYEELEKNGYTKEGSIGNGSSLQRAPEALIISHCRSFLPDKKIDCIFVLAQIKQRDAKGHAIYSAPFDMLHIKLPKGWSYFDSGDAECLADGYPKADVITIGQWAWRKKPLLGGYAYSLKKAWLVNYQKMQFVEISTQGVKCGFEDDRD